MKKFIYLAPIVYFATLFMGCGPTSDADKYKNSKAYQNTTPMTTAELSSTIQNAIANNFAEDDDKENPETTSNSLNPASIFLSVGGINSPVVQNMISNFPSSIAFSTMANIVTHYGGNPASFWNTISGVLINLNDLSGLSLTEIKTLIETALNYSVPIIFENKAILDDFMSNWSNETAIQYAETLAGFLGVGANSQILIAVSNFATEANAIKLYTLGVNAVLDLANNEGERNPPANPIGSDSVPTEENVSINSASYVEQGGYPKNSPTKQYYRSYELRPWKKTYWKPDKHERQDFRNSIYYKIQLTWDEHNSKKYLRIFTLNKGGFKVPDSMLKNNSDGRGYFMYRAEISFSPINSHGHNSWPSWLQTCDNDSCISPTYHVYDYADYSDRLYNSIYYKYASNSGELLQRIVKNEIAGFTVYTYTYPPKWIFQETKACNADLRLMNDPDPADYGYSKAELRDARKVCSYKHMKFDNDGMQNYFHTPKSNAWEQWKVSIGKNSDWFKDSISNRPHMPVYRARVGFTPLVMFKAWTNDTVNSKQRFKLKSTQYAKMVYRFFGERTETHKNSKYRTIIVDFSKVGN